VLALKEDASTLCATTRYSLQQAQCRNTVCAVLVLIVTKAGALPAVPRTDAEQVCVRLYET
jgi:hypothetical protein